MISRKLKSLVFYTAAVAIYATLPSAACGEEIPETFVPAGPMGMGGAFTAVANDENSVWTNPAGMARVRKARSRKKVHLIKFPNIFATANTTGKSFYQGLQNSQEKSVESIIENADIADKPFFARMGIFPMMMFEFGQNRPATFGAVMNTKVSALISEDDPERAKITSISDLGGVFGLAFTNRTNRLSLGFNVRPTYRYAFEDKIDSSILLDKQAFGDLIKNESNSATGLGIDVGVIYTMADFWFPTFGVSILNVPTGCQEDYLNPFSEKRETVCGTVFSGDFANEEALSRVDPTDIRFGFSITPRFSKNLALRLAFDYHHFYVASGDSGFGLSEIEASKLLHFGTELVFGNPLLIHPFSVKFGMNQGFVTSGVSMRMPYFSFELVTYGVDISSDESPKEDRRVSASLSFDF